MRFSDKWIPMRSAREAEGWNMAGLYPLPSYSRAQLVTLASSSKRKRDAAGAPKNLTITKTGVNSTMKLALRLAPGGGAAIRFRPRTNPSVRYFNSRRREIRQVPRPHASLARNLGVYFSGADERT